VYPPWTPILNDTERQYGEVEIGGEVKRYKKGKTVGEYTPWLKEVKGENGQALGDYFIDNSAFLDDYVNSNETRAAMNIPDSVQAWE